MGILSLIGLLVVIGWVFGFSLHIAGGFIHLLVLIAVILFLIDFFTARRVL